jgi:hypothetical protein
MDEEIIISFGDLYKAKFKGHTFCIVDVGEDNHFFDSRRLCSRRDPSKYKFVHYGTGGPENIGKIIGRMGVEEVVEGFREGARDGWFFDEESERLLREAAAKPPRRLKLR